MRAAVLQSFNQPWQVKDLPDPTPGPGQVVIRIRASGVCGGDVHLHHGQFPLKPPLVAGHEPVGDIAALGPGVLGLKVGDRVGVPWLQRGCGRCEECQAGNPGGCVEGGQTWMHLGGGNSELMLAWADGCVALPEGLSYEEAAPIFCAGYTVFSGLRAGRPEPGARVAVMGIGGLGHLALQYSRALGFATIAVTSSDDKKAEAKRFGADEVVVARDEPGKALKALGGVDVILSTTENVAQIANAFTGLKRGGRLVSVGAPSQPIPVNPMNLIMGQVQLVGSTQGPRRDLVDALKLSAKGKVKPMLELYPLEKVNDVLQRLMDGKVRYRAILQHRA